MEPGSTTPHSQGLSNNPILSQIYPILNIFKHLFKLNSNIVLTATTRSSKSFPSCRIIWYNSEIIPTIIYSGYLPCPSKYSWFNLRDYFRLTVQTTKNLIVVFPFPIIIPFGPKLSPQDPVFKHPYSRLRDHISQRMSHNWQYYCFVYFNFQILKEKSRTRMCLDRIRTWIPFFENTFYLLDNRISIY